MVFYRLHALMKSWRKQLAVLVLLLVPLQAIAASLSAFTCHTGEAHHAAADAHVHDTLQTSHAHDDDGASHQHEGDASGDRSGHLNCHHVFSGMPTVMTLSEAPDLPAFESSISLLITLFVPEQPRRPPRA